MKTIAEIMTKDVLGVAPSATLGEVARALRARNVGSALVVDAERRPVGIISERELVDSVAASRNPDHGLAESWMKADPRVIASATGVAEAGALMRDLNVRHLAVVDDGQLVGVVSIRDLLSAALLDA